MSSSFPWLTALIVVPLLGAVGAVGAAGRRARGPRPSRSASPCSSSCSASRRSPRSTSPTPAPYQLVRGARLDPRVRGVLRASASTASASPSCSCRCCSCRSSCSPPGASRAALTVATDQLRRYLALVLVLEAFMVAVFAARDVFLFYVLFEAMLIPVYFMIGAVRRGPAAVRGREVPALLARRRADHARRASSRCTCRARAGRRASSSTTSSALDAATRRPSGCMFGAFFLAFAIKAPMFPVHTWLPDAAEQAPAGTSTLLVGVLDKVGTFGMLTLCLPLFPDAVALGGAGDHRARRHLDPLRGAAGDRAGGPHAADRLHVGVALRLHRAGHLRVHVDVERPGLVVLHGQPRALDRARCSSSPGFLVGPARVAADRRLRRAAEGRAGAGRDVPRRRPVGAVAAGPVDVRQRVPRARRHLRAAPGRRDRRDASAWCSPRSTCCWTYQRIFTGPVRTELAGHAATCRRARSGSSAR